MDFSSWVVVTSVQVGLFADFRYTVWALFRNG